MSKHLVTKGFRVLLLFAAVFASPACTPTHRCPAGYDVFGPSTLPLGGNVAEMFTKLRGFIWLHWHQHQRGCAQVTTTSMWEGVRCTSTYLVEDDKKGRWPIPEEWECGPGARGIPKAASGTSTWYSIDRVPLESIGKRLNEPLPDSAVVQADSYVLVLTDMSGKRKSKL